MWKWINSFAQPEKAYGACNSLLPYFFVLMCVGLPLGVIWGLAFAPTDYQQFDVYRIIFIHVPTASLSLTAYVSMAVAAFVGLVWQWRSAYMAMIAIAPIGIVVTFISLFTGAIWGKPTWGTYWFWGDARLVSQLILLFLYMGVLAIYSSFDDKQQGAKAAAVLAVVGVINIPIIKYSVEWWNTLHQTASINKLDKPSMPAEMAIPLVIAMLGMAGYIGTLAVLRLRNELIKRDSHRPWVGDLLASENATARAKIPMIAWFCIVVLLAFGFWQAFAQGFKFDDMTAFFDMGGRGLYVWLSYGVGVTCLMLLLLQSTTAHSRFCEQARKQIARKQQVQQLRAKKKSNNE